MLREGDPLTLVAVVVVGLLVLAIVLFYVVGFLQDREISFWPPKIGGRSGAEGPPESSARPERPGPDGPACEQLPSSVDVRGRYVAEWWDEEEGGWVQDVLSITHHDGDELRGKRMYGNGPTKRFRFSGRLIGVSILGYLVPLERRGSPASVLLQVADDHCTKLVGRVLWVEERGDVRSTEEGEWNRRD